MALFELGLIKPLNNSWPLLTNKRWQLYWRLNGCYVRYLMSYYIPRPRHFSARLAARIATGAIDQ